MMGLNFSHGTWFTAFYSTLKVGYYMRAKPLGQKTLKEDCVEIFIIDLSC